MGIVLFIRWVRAASVPVRKEKRLRGAELAGSMEAGVAATIAATLKFSKGMTRQLARKPLGEIIKTGLDAGMIRVGCIPIPRTLEAECVLNCGAPGSGKSFAIGLMLADLRARGDRVVIFDNGNEFSKKFRRKGDLILSPFHKDSVGWSARNEAPSPYYWKLVSNSVIPEGDGAAKHWHAYARSLFTDVGTNVGEQSDNREILRLLTEATPEELAIAVKGSPSAAYCQDGNKEFLGSVRSVAATFCGGWELMRDGDFSIREFILGNNKSWLWLPYKDSQLAATKHLLATLADLLVSGGLDRKSDGSGIRTWIVIDELDSLGPLGRFCDAVTKLRKRNVIIVVGVQSRAQLAKLYGDTGADAVPNSLSNRVFFRAGDLSLAEWESKQIGGHEIEETKKQRSHHL